MREGVLAIGEAMVEMAPNGAGAYAMGFAGDVFNTAWYARRVLPTALPVRFFSAVGEDAISDRMLRFMQEAGVETRWVARRPDRTVGLYLIDLLNGERSFAYWRSVSAARTLADDPDTLAAALKVVRLAYFSGITLAILEPPARVRLLDVLRAARAEGCVVAFDPNLRPRLWPDATTMRDAIMRAAAVADIALPSFDDEAAHFGDADPEATAARYAGAGARLVVVKNGPGPILCRADGALTRHDPEPSVAVVDSTAAGDSFNAAFLGRRLFGDDLATAIRAGARLAAFVVGQRGALAEPPASACDGRG